MKLARRYRSDPETDGNLTRHPRLIAAMAPAAAASWGRIEMSHPPTARGVDHIGLTVPDIQSAEEFLINGLGAEFLYETLNADQPPFKGPETERAIGLPPGAEVNIIRMYRMQQGPGIELFQYSHCEQRPAARCCDNGWQHLALYVDDLEAAIDRAVRVGGELLAPPWSLIGAESGEGNRFCMIRAPFGAVIELITFPSPQPYEETTPNRRWKPPAR